MSLLRRVLAFAAVVVLFGCGGGDEEAATADREAGPPHRLEQALPTGGSAPSYVAAVKSQLDALDDMWGMLDEADFHAYYDGDTPVFVSEQLALGDYGYETREYIFKNGQLHYHYVEGERSDLMVVPATRESYTKEVWFDAQGDAVVTHETLDGDSTEMDANEITTALSRGRELFAQAVKFRHSKVVRGHVRLERQLPMFELCGTYEYVPLKKHRGVSAAYMWLSRYGVGRIFVDLVVAEQPSAEGAIEVLAVRRASPAEERFDCDDDLTDVEFEAHSSDPSWQLAVTTSEITFYVDGMEDVASFPHVAGEEDGDAITYATEAGGVALTITITREHCRDGYVGARYAFTAEVDVDGETYRGCAWPGDAYDR